jgi:hypothetical protein
MSTSRPVRGVEPAGAGGGRFDAGAREESGARDGAGGGAETTAATAASVASFAEGAGGALDGAGAARFFAGVGLRETHAAVATPIARTPSAQARGPRAREVGCAPTEWP